ncbi:hypothetical protein B0H17DRAFT_1144822 [Mycena rosella]|uniref:Uncharacterized protein n=1 Tax=Mycena rosella TaxID=1033263 RepID=A0AAD7CS51_MYCRO|nr:hypothetical protein B0H17DRAFT_1144822 [Mycena rosella]
MGNSTAELRVLREPHQSCVGDAPRVEGRRGRDYTVVRKVCKYKLPVNLAESNSVLTEGMERKKCQTQRGGTTPGKVGQSACKGPVGHSRRSVDQVFRVGAQREGRDASQDEAELVGDMATRSKWGRDKEKDSHMNEMEEERKGDDTRRPVGEDGMFNRKGQETPKLLLAQTQPRYPPRRHSRFVVGQTSTEEGGCNARKMEGRKSGTKVGGREDNEVVGGGWWYKNNHCLAQLDRTATLRQRVPLAIRLSTSMIFDNNLLSSAAIRENLLPH